MKQVIRRRLRVPELLELLELADRTGMTLVCHYTGEVWVSAEDHPLDGFEGYISLDAWGDIVSVDGEKDWEYYSRMICLTRPSFLDDSGERRSLEEVRAIDAGRTDVR